MENATGFSKWRLFFWPVHRIELKKFLPLLLMFFLIAFNYNVLRSFKDAIVVTAENSGAEAIPFIKVWGVFPAAILLTFLFTRLSNRFSREKVFYVMMSFFLIFFFLFAFVLYPAREYLHPHEFADMLQKILPQGFKGFIAIFRNWTFSLFYIISELWSTAIFSVLFWGFANEVTTVSEAKRYYGILATGGNIAGIFAGQAAIWFSGDFFISWIPYGKTAWDQSILFLVITLLLAGFLTMAIFRWLNVQVIQPLDAKEPSIVREASEKMSMRKNFAYLIRSKYLIYIAVIVFSYNLAINLVEVVWKNQMRALYPNPSDYNIYMGQVMVWMAIIATITGLFTTTNLIRRYSWTLCALIAPIIVGVTGLFFFGVILYQDISSVLFGVSPLMLAVTLGSIQNCLSRASKYTFFDTTKEIAFIPLSNQSKLKGKAAIDGVGSRVGKSGGSVIHSGLLLMFSSVTSSTPYVAIIFLGIILVWALSVMTLGKQFNELTSQSAELEILESKKEKPVFS